MVYTTKQLLDALKNKEFNTIRIEQVKVSNRWINKETTQEHFTVEQQRRFLSKDTLRFFKNLGGKESVKQGRYLSVGCTVNTSTSPDGSERKLTYFFD